MQTYFRSLPVIRRGTGLVLVALALGAALPAAAQNRSERQSRFEADRQVCLSGKSSQDFDACMKEARAALQERPGSTPKVSPEQLQRNSALRCEALAGEDRVACLARMQGKGTVSGSVAGGGLLRELTTTE